MDLYLLKFNTLMKKANFYRSEKQSAFMWFKYRSLKLDCEGLPPHFFIPSRLENPVHATGKYKNLEKKSSIHKYYILYVSICVGGVCVGVVYVCMCVCVYVLVWVCVCVYMHVWCNYWLDLPSVFFFSFNINNKTEFLS